MLPRVHRGSRRSPSRFGSDTWLAALTWPSRMPMWAERKSELGLSSLGGGRLSPPLAIRGRQMSPPPKPAATASAERLYVDGLGCKLTEDMVTEDHSALMLAALMIGHHFSISAR